MNMLNQLGIDLIKSFEGCKLKAYPDPATGGKPWTIGYGHTGSEVSQGLIWTQGQADNQLESDLHAICDRIHPFITVDLNDNQFSSLVSLAYNIGVGHFKSSTLLKLLNATHLDEASNEFSKWGNAGGHPMTGLMTRRLAEQKLFLTPVT